jgi:hypothetical protein
MVSVNTVKLCHRFWFKPLLQALTNKIEKNAGRRKGMAVPKRRKCTTKIIRIRGRVVRKRK